MIEEIRKFREKYPDYNDMDDMSLAQSLASKYPEYADLPDKVKSESKGGGLVSGLIKQAPRTVGGILGGMVGAGVSVPTGGAIAPYSVPIGIGLGAAFGESLEQLRESFMGDKEKPKTAWEAIKRPAMAGIEEPAAQLTGEKAIRIVGKVLSPYAKTVSKEAQVTIDYLKDKLKPILTPSEATENRMLDIAENIVEGSLLGGGKITKFKILRQKILDNMADDIIDQFGQRASADELGELFIKSVEGRHTIFNRLKTEPLYHRVDEMASTSPIDITKIKNFIKPYIKLAKDVNKIESKNAGDDLIMAVDELENVIDFPVARELRSRLLSRIDEFSVINKKAPAIGKAKQIIKLLDQNIEESLGKSNPEALEIWRDANRLYREGQKQFNNRLIRGLIRKSDPEMGGDPEAIVNGIFKAGMGSRIQRVKDAVDPYTFKQFQSYFTQNLIKKSINDEGKLIGEKLYNSMYGRTGYGENVLKNIFNQEQLSDLTKFAIALKTTQQATGESTGRMYIQLAQAGAVTGVTSSIFMPSTARKIVLSSSGVVIFGPSVLSRILMNPTTNKLLTTGIKLSPKTMQFGGIVARIANATRNAEQKHKEWLEEDLPKKEVAIP